MKQTVTSSLAIEGNQAMSRYQAPAKANGKRVVVGWDQPLLTYFFQVIDIRKLSSDPDNAVEVSKGTAFREIYNFEDLVRAISPYAHLTMTMRSLLHADRDDLTNY